MQFTGIEHWTPRGWSPYVSRLPANTAARLDLAVHPVSNPVAPGYAYGTMKPLLSPKTGMSYGNVPYIRPVAKTFSLQIPMRPQIQGVTPNTGRALSVQGTLPYLPNGGDQAEVFQASIASMLR